MALVLTADSVVPQRRVVEFGWIVGQTDDEIVRSHVSLTKVTIFTSINSRRPAGNLVTGK